MTALAMGHVNRKSVYVYLLILERIAPYKSVLTTAQSKVLVNARLENVHVMPISSATTVASESVRMTAAAMDCVEMVYVSVTLVLPAMTAVLRNAQMTAMVMGYVKMVFVNVHKDSVVNNAMRKYVLLIVITMVYVSRDVVNVNLDLSVNSASLRNAPIAVALMENVTPILPAYVTLDSLVRIALNESALTTAMVMGYVQRKVCVSVMTLGRAWIAWIKNVAVQIEVYAIEGNAFVNLDILATSVNIDHVLQTAMESV
jgi:hypothetical protein